MAAPLPQERAFKRQFDQNRLAAIRGATFRIPDIGSSQGSANTTDFFVDTPAVLPDNVYRFPRPANSPRVAPIIPANTTRHFSDTSEDQLLQSIRQSPDVGQTQEQEMIPDPSEFTRRQQQARIAEGIGAPELLPADVAALPDPEYSTEDDVVTYGESLDALSAEAQQADSLDTLGAFRSRIQQKTQDALDAALENLRAAAEEKAQRWIAKGVGNGGNALDSVGWDGWITFTVLYIYLLARAVVTVFVPRQTSVSEDGILTYTTRKGLHTLLPDYRPLRESGDFAYFIGVNIIICTIATIISALFIAIVVYVLYPLFFVISVVPPS